MRIAMWLWVGTMLVGAQERVPLPEVAFQIEAMVMADQEARTRWLEMSKSGKGFGIEAVRDLSQVDGANTKLLKSFVDQYGWLTPKRVGVRASHNAWLLVQHADPDPHFQERCLKLMEPLLRTKEVVASDYAYLFDRVATAQGRPQRFGTQFEIKNGVAKMKKTEDPARLDVRRKRMGMMPIAQYRKFLEELYLGKRGQR